jgi:hypothetical protein
MTINQEAEVKRVVRNPSIKTSGGLPMASAINRTVHGGTYATAILTGSAVVNCKSTSGRATLATSAPVDAEKGYAEWEISQLTSDSYVVLHRDDVNKLWFVSLLPAASVLGTDIKLACIRNFRNVEQIWKSDIYAAASAVATSHPFKIECDINNNNDVVAQIVDGHVQNVTLSNPLATENLGSVTAQYRIFIKVDVTGSVYPSAVTWDSLISTTPLPANDDTKAHVLIGTVNVTAGTGGGPPTFSINQMVSTSLNTVRVKWGPGATDIYYLFNRV